MNAKEFGNLLKQKRMKQNITQEQLAEGICTIVAISKIEQGEVVLEKSIRDRLLERLGENSYDYENYVTAKEYEKWKAEFLLLDALDDETLREAEWKLQQYEKSYKGKINRQFYLTMLLELWKLKKDDKEEYGSVLEEAVKLTIPKIDTKSITGLVLSVTELNLVLEYITYENSDNVKELYQELIQYIKQEKFDLESKALFCSKVCLYFCNYQWKLLKDCKDKIEAIALAEELLEVATLGIESFRNHEKLYFTWELLQMKQQVLMFLLEEPLLLQRKERYQKEQEQTENFFEVWDSLYEEYQIPKQTNLYTIFYRKREVYCINDVIRAKRKMFGLRLQDLTDICELKTIQRIEKKASKIQIGLAQQLFQRFDLSMEMQRSSVVTSSEEAIWLEKKFRLILNQKRYEEAMELLQKLKEMVSMKELINQQYIEYYEEAYLVYQMKKISKAEFIKRAIKILEYTIPLKIALKPLGIIRLSNGRKQQGEKYFTTHEIRILYNIAQELEVEEKEKYFVILREYLESLEKEVTISPILGVYGLVMSAIASHMGNRKQYDASSRINEKIIEQSLRLRHSEYVEKNLYSLMWNEENKKGLPEKENPERILCMKDCITIANYNKNQMRENWMKNRIKGILKD